MIRWPIMMRAETSEAGDLSYLEARLLSRFSQLHADEVRRCLRDSVAQFDGARIRTFLAVLIERAATDRLRDLERASGETDASFGAKSQRATETPQLRETSRVRENSSVVRTGQRVVPALGR